MTASISRLQAQKTAPVRHTKLAYINSDAKPPREVLRRQMKHRNEMLHSPAVNGKRKVHAATAASSVTDVMPSPKKRHSAPGACVVPGACSFPGRAESSPQSKGLCMLFNKRLAISELQMHISITTWASGTCSSLSIPGSNPEACIILMRNVKVQCRMGVENCFSG